MGTRSLTVVQEGDTEIVVMYRQFDGYLEGHGKDLAEFLDGIPVVNGIGDNRKVFNGVGCLAASLVAHFKDGAGSIYLYPAGTRDCGEEYTYIIKAEQPTYGFGDASNTYPTLEIEAYGSPVFKGTVEEFKTHLKGLVEA